MPKVPKYESQVNQDIGTVPTAPTINRTGNLDAMNKVATANENLGKTVTGIGDLLAKHAAQQQELNNDQAVASAYTNASRTMNDWLTNNNDEVVKVDGKDQVQKVGFLNRPLGQAKDITNQFAKKYSENRDGWTKGITSPRHRLELEKMMDSKYESSINSVARYEGNQLNENNLMINKGAVAQTVSDAYNSQDEISLKKSIDTVDNNQTKLNFAAGITDVGLSNQEIQKARKSVIENAVMGKVMATGSTKEANDLLNSVANKYGTRSDGSFKGSGFLGELKRPDGSVSTEISVGVNIDGKEMEIPTLVPTLTESEKQSLLNGEKPSKEIVGKAIDFAKERMAKGQSVFSEGVLSQENYDGLKTKIEKAGVQLQAAAVHATNVQNTQTRFDVMDGFISGKYNIANSSQLISKLAASDQKSADVLKEAIESPKGFVPSSEKGFTYKKLVDSVYNSGTAEEVSKFNIAALKEHANGNISREQLGILYNASIQRAKAFQADGTLTPAQIQIDGGAKAIMQWNKVHGNNDPETLSNYMKGVAEGKSNLGAYNEAIRTTIIKQHPEVASQEDIPNVIISNNGNSKVMVFPSATNIFPAKIFNSKTGRAEINVNRSKGSQDKAK